MKIAVMGAGGVGGYFGGRLAQAGEEVSLIARGAHLAAIRTEGLRILSPLGDATVVPALATEDPGEVGPVDIVLFCVKLWDTEAAAEAIRPLIGERTAVISLQNGIAPEEMLSTALGPAHVMGGVSQISAAIEAPGVVRHFAPLARLEFGELDNRPGARAEALLAACTRAGIDAAIPDDIVAAIWRKFVFLSAMSAANCLTRLPIGPVREDPATRALLETLLGEAAAVTRTKGIAIADDLEARVMEFIDSWPPDASASMLKDLEAGKPLEVKWLSGAVAALGAELGVATPAHRVAFAALKPHAAGRA
jgi:2-dehydropantoate 2-reductase